MVERLQQFVEKLQAGLILRSSVMSGCKLTYIAEILRWTYKTSSLCYMTATEALSNFRARTLSPVELVSALIKRATSLDSKDKVPHRGVF